MGAIVRVNSPPREGFHMASPEKELQAGLDVMASGLIAMTKNIEHRAPLAVKDLKRKLQEAKKVKNPSADKKLSMQQYSAFIDLIGKLGKHAKGARKAFLALNKIAKKNDRKGGDLATLKDTASTLLRSEQPFYHACEEHIGILDSQGMKPEKLASLSATAVTGYAKNYLDPYRKDFVKHMKAAGINVYS
jgi:hypothetical protein